MARLPTSKKETKTAAAIFRAAEQTLGDDSPRTHLGCSQVGKDCERDVWYGFRWASKVRFSGRILRLFDRGHREEKPVFDLLRVAGVQIVDDQESDELQVDLGCHMRGTLDGRAIGILEAPKTEHVVDVKTANRKSFAKAVACGDDLEKWSPIYYAQAQLYMLGKNLKRAIYIVVNKDDDDLHTMRVKFDRERAERLRGKGHRIALAPEPPPKISDDPTFWKCKRCDHTDHCQYKKPEALRRSCRSCASVTPKHDGSWWCEHHQKALDEVGQFSGCDDHLFIPALLPWQAEEFDEQHRTLTYRRRDGSRIIDTGDDLEIRP